MKFIKQIKPKYLIGAIIVFLLVILIQAGFTFAYFDAIITGNDTASTNTVGSLYPNLTFTGTASNTFDLEAGNSISWTVNVKNTGNSTIESYKVFFSDVINNFGRKNEIKYSLYCTSSLSKTCNSVSRTSFPVGNEMVLEQGSIEPGETHTYGVSINYTLPTTSHTTNEGKTISFKMTIGELVGDTFLSNKIIASAGGVDEIKHRGAVNLRKLGSTETGVYVTQDNDGDTYFFRGGATNNYIKFANQIWRIVRINGDGSIRLVLNDYIKTGNADVYELPYNSSTECQNITTMDAAIECAKYGHGAYANGSIANEINEWYNLNFTNDDKKYLIQDGSFCNDYSKSESGTNSDYFGESTGIISDFKAVDLTCKAASGYTYGEAKILNLPVGLLSAEEIIFAGAYYSSTVTSTTNHYLYIDSYNSWSMTPHLWNSSTYKNNAYTYGRTSISSNLIDNSYPMRPVINLQSNVMVSGSGTSSDPYEIIGGPSTLVDKILANENGTDAIEEKLTPDFSYTATTDQGMYATLDQDGITYYYRGNVNDNYVSFDDKLWRIIRINGDGSVRLVLNTSALTSLFNSNTNCASGNVSNVTTAIECMKYGYGTYADDSVANKISQWYTTNISEESKKYIKKDGKFCFDYSYNPAITTSIIFGTNYRNSALDGNTFPQLTCKAPNAYTAGGTETLYLPVGLITGDEMAMAGGVHSITNSSFYLHNMTSMSPYAFSSYAYIMGNINNTLYYSTVSSNLPFSPVINIYGYLSAIGNGTINNPYKIYEY